MSSSTIATPASLPPEFAAMIETLKDIAATEDALGASVQIAAGILAAGATGDEDAIFGAADAGTVSGEDYIDIPFRAVHDRITWKKSGDQYENDGGFPYFALVRTWNADGDPMVLSCGGQSVVPTLFALWDNGVLERYGDEGMWVTLRQVRTNSGYDLLKLSRAPGKKS